MVALTVLSPVPIAGDQNLYKWWQWSRATSIKSRRRCTVQPPTWSLGWLTILRKVAWESFSSSAKLGHRFSRLWISQAVSPNHSHDLASVHLQVSSWYFKLFLNVLPANMELSRNQKSLYKWKIYTILAIIPYRRDFSVSLNIFAIIPYGREYTFFEPIPATIPFSIQSRHILWRAAFALVDKTEWNELFGAKVLTYRVVQKFVDTTSGTPWRSFRLTLRYFKFFKWSLKDTLVFVRRSL